MVSGFIEKLHNLRLLPVFVIISMIVGVAFGKFYGILYFELTPPIDAIKSIFNGTYSFSIGNTIALGIVIDLFMMMYPAMANIKFEDIGKSVKSPKQLLQEEISR